MGLTRPRCAAPPGLMLLAGACVLVLLTSACSATQAPDTGGGPPGKLEPNGPISWSEASARLGEVLTVEGPVQSAGPSGVGDGAIVLNIGLEAPDSSRFIVVIPKHALKSFPASPADHYAGALIRATGRITNYDGVAAIIVRSPRKLTTNP